MTDDRTRVPPRIRRHPPPELADWWVWGVRRIAAPIADLLLAARVLPLVFALLKVATWAFTRDPNELWGAGAALAGLVALWGGGMLLGRFSAERDSPDPERWWLSSPCQAWVTQLWRAAPLRRQSPASSRHPASGAAEPGRGAGIVSQAMAGMAGVKRISPAGPLMMRVMSSVKV